MANIALTVTVFHTLAAVAVLGLMVFGVLGAVRRDRG